MTVIADNSAFSEEMTLKKVFLKEEVLSALKTIVLTLLQ